MNVTLEDKRCSRCKQVKPKDQFFRDRSRKSGLSPQCKECQKEGRKRRNPSSGTSERGRQLWLARDGKKRCGKCREIKTVESFSKNRVRPDGLQHYCRTCQQEAVRLSDQRHPEAKARRNRRATLKMKYGLTVEEFELMMLEQNGKCAICHEEMTKPHVDHDHSCCPGQKTCGKCVRALLCTNCNMSLGGFKDSTELLLRAISYLDAYRDTKGHVSVTPMVEDKTV